MNIEITHKTMMFNCLTEQKNNEERKANKKLRKLSDEQRADIERQYAEESQIMRKQFEDHERRKEEYKQKKIQERVERERVKEIARKKENEQIRRQEEQNRLRKAQEEQVRRAEEKHRAEEKRRVEEEIRIEEQMRFEEAIRRTQAEKMRQLQNKQFIDNEINELLLKYPSQTHRTCVLKLCKKYHPDKNPTADPEYIRILNSMK